MNHPPNIYTFNCTPAMQINQIIIKSHVKRFPIYTYIKVPSVATDLYNKLSYSPSTKQDINKDKIKIRTSESY